MRLRAFALVFAAALQAQPTFHIGVDLIRTDVSVADKDGRPVRDLSPDDFVVTIDGSPRQVAFARLYGSGVMAAGAPATGPTPTYATHSSAQPGRVVVFVVDLESMNAGYERVLLETAASLVDKLGPGDAVGLLPLPGKGVEITRDHARVRLALVALKGFAPKIFQQHLISMQEALAFEKHDTRIIREVIERECRQYETECPMDLRNEAGQLLIEARRRIQNIVTTLGMLNARLQPIHAPKDVVLLSAGLPFDPETLAYFRDLERRVAASGTATHIVQLAQPETDASSQRMAGTGALPASDLRQGLSMVAAVTGGDFFEGVGRANGVFERIANEITYSWQLGIEATPQDADGKTHKIAVSTKRQGLIVRARRELILADAAPVRLNPVDLLAQPIDAVELPITAATYSVRGGEAATLKQVFLIHAGDIGTDPPPGYALAVLKDDRPVFQTNDQLAVAGREADVITAAQLSPGRYRLRVAVTDAAGRGGSLEMPLSVGLRAGGPIQFSDLFVGHLGNRFTPATEATRGAPMGALIELYAADASTFAGVTVEFELRRSDTEAILAHSAARITATDLPGRRIADAAIEVAHIDPGAHTVSALISLGGAVIGKVSRAIQITR